MGLSLRGAKHTLDAIQTIKRIAVSGMAQSDKAFKFISQTMIFRKVNVAANWTAIGDWTIDQIAVAPRISHS